MRWRLIAFVVALQALGLAAAAGPVLAQDELVARCTSLASTGLRAQCAALAQGAAIAQPRIGLAAAGGNPLSGSSSTLGMRMGATPRVAAELRLTGARLTVPAHDASLGGSARPDESALATGVASSTTFTDSSSAFPPRQISSCAVEPGDNSDAIGGSAEELGTSLPLRSTAS